MDKVNEKRKSYFIFVVMAGIGGIIFGISLFFIVRMSIILGKVLLKYWWGVLIGIAIIFLLRLRKRKGKK